MGSAYLVLALTVGLSGCVSSHEFYLMGRKTGVVGTGVVPANGHRGGPITISLGGKTYSGRWVLMETGGSVGISTGSVVSGSRSATAIGTNVELPTGGNGSVVAAASDGSTLRCTFDFREMNLRGVGVCLDSRGETYDLQIS